MVIHALLGMDRETGVSVFAGVVMLGLPVFVVGVFVLVVVVTKLLRGGELQRLAD